MKGFTLIELLVVVLIIGILSAVALPQYQKAVLKSRQAQALVIAKSIERNAIEYHLANGAWPASSLLPDLVDYKEKNCIISGSVLCRVNDYLMSYTQWTDAPSLIVLYSPASRNSTFSVKYDDDLVGAGFKVVSGELIPACIASNTSKVAQQICSPYKRRITSIQSPNIGPLNLYEK